MQGIVEVLRTFDSEHNVNNTRREAGALSDLLECDVTIEYCDHKAAMVHHPSVAH